jgi:hypothetical protein
LRVEGRGWRELERPKPKTQNPPVGACCRKPAPCSRMRSRGTNQCRGLLWQTRPGEMWRTLIPPSLCSARLPCRARPRGAYGRGVTRPPRSPSGAGASAMWRRTFACGAGASVSRDGRHGHDGGSIELISLTEHRLERRIALRPAPMPGPAAMSRTGSRPPDHARGFIPADAGPTHRATLWVPFSSFRKRRAR